MFLVNPLPPSFHSASLTCLSFIFLPPPLHLMALAFALPSAHPSPQFGTSTPFLSFFRFQLKSNLLREAFLDHPGQYSLPSCWFIAFPQELYSNGVMNEFNEGALQRYEWTGLREGSREW